MEQNFKITVCAAVGNKGNYNSNDDISQKLAKWLIKDDENILRGPKIRIAACETVGGENLHAIAYRDIFDKKKSQKILRFFAAGFAGMEDALYHWAAVAKSTTKPIF